MKILFIVIFITLMYPVNSFIMNILLINSKHEYNNIVKDKSDKKVILYSSNPCKACEKTKENMVILSKNIKEWNFYEIDIRIIYDICKNKKINRLPVLEFYKYNNDPYIIRCTPFIENNILQNFN